MNGPVVPDLATKYDVQLDILSNGETDWEYVQQLMEDLEATTTLTDPTIKFDDYEPTAQHNGFIVDPLCRWLYNLRRRNQHHPLRILTLSDANLVENGMLNEFEKFLVAAKHFGIVLIKFIRVDGLPVHLLEEFCRDNTILERLDLVTVSLSSTETAPSLPPNDGPQDSAGTLILSDVSFENSTAATNFATVLAHMNVKCLLLGEITAHDGRNNGDDVDVARTERVVSEFSFPTVKYLSLLDNCQLKHFEAALEAVTTSVIFLFVAIECFEFIDDDASAKLNLLASFLRRTVKLGGLDLRTRVRPPLEFFQALEACATVLFIHVHSDVLFIQVHSDGRISELQRNVMVQDPIYSRLSGILERGIAMTYEEIVTRNRALARFVANPSNYPADVMLDFMRLFDNCPTGRYMMALCLPTVVPFQNLASSVGAEPTKKNWNYYCAIGLAVFGLCFVVSELVVLFLCASF